VSTDVRALAIRFADLWAVDPHQMVDEIYADDIVMENMANPARLILGSAHLHAVEDELSARIPEHRHELIRVTAGDDVACLETTIVAPLTHEYGPACVWWWIDETGKVAAEVGWFDWADRSTDSARSHGTVPPNRSIGGAGRDDAGYRRVADEYARCWSDDPLGTGVQMFAADCTFGHVGRGERRGIPGLIDSRRELLAELPVAGRSMEVQRVLGEGSCVAMLITIGDATRSTRGTVVLSLDDDDRIISERTYCDWAKAIPREPPSGGQSGTRHPVGSPEWTLGG